AGATFCPSRQYSNFPLSFSAVQSCFVVVGGGRRWFCASGSIFVSRYSGISILLIYCGLLAGCGGGDSGEYRTFQSQSEPQS
ncbi:MAG TPA: hypothetical protein DCR20_01310, partial [Planctomycetaceae bacterium]|nr:hypothetical protein [Planctomycetaceae bacterium]